MAPCNRNCTEKYPCCCVLITASFTLCRIESASFTLYRIRLLFTLHHSNPVRDVEQKSLRFGGDMKSNPICAGAVQTGQSGTLRYKVGFGVYVSTLSPLFAHFYNTLQNIQLLFVSPYNHLLFLAKTNKENDNNIDFSLSKEQNLKKYSSILDKSETKQRLVVKLFKVLLLVFNTFQYIGKKCFSYFHGDSERHELATE